MLLQYEHELFKKYVFKAYLNTHTYLQIPVYMHKDMNRRNQV